MLLPTNETTGSTLLQHSGDGEPPFMPGPGAGNNTNDRNSIIQENVDLLEEMIDLALDNITVQSVLTTTNVPLVEKTRAFDLDNYDESGNEIALSTSDEYEIPVLMPEDKNITIEGEGLHGEAGTIEIKWGPHDRVTEAILDLSAENNGTTAIPSVVAIREENSDESSRAQGSVEEEEEESKLTSTPKPITSLGSHAKLLESLTNLFRSYRSLKFTDNYKINPFDLTNPGNQFLNQQADCYLMLSSEGEKCAGNVTEFFGEGDISVCCTGYEKRSSILTEFEFEGDYIRVIGFRPSSSLAADMSNSSVPDSTSEDEAEDEVSESSHHIYKITLRSKDENSKPICTPAVYQYKAENSSVIIQLPMLTKKADLVYYLDSKQTTKIPACVHTTLIPKGFMELGLSDQDVVTRIAEDDIFRQKVVENMRKLLGEDHYIFKIFEPIPLENETTSTPVFTEYIEHKPDYSAYNDYGSHSSENQPDYDVNVTISSKNETESDVKADLPTALPALIDESDIPKITNFVTDKPVVQEDDQSNDKYEEIENSEPQGRPLAMRSSDDMEEDENDEEHNGLFGYIKTAGKGCLNKDNKKVNIFVINQDTEDHPSNQTECSRSWRDNILPKGCFERFFFQRPKVYVVSTAPKNLPPHQRIRRRRTRLLPRRPRPRQLGNLHRPNALFQQPPQKSKIRPQISKLHPRLLLHQARGQ